MIPGFQCFADPNGDLWCADGWVAQLRSGVRLPAGSGLPLPPMLLPYQSGYFRELAETTGWTQVGGSGRNLFSSGLTPGLSGPPLPIGLWTPGRPNAWTLGIFTLTKTGSSAANISDGTNTVASLSTGSAPVGDYVATTYGKTTYHGGADFTIATAVEEGAPGGFPTLDCTVTAGTVQTGEYVPTDAANSVSTWASDWTLYVAADGSAEFRVSGSAIAIRESGSPLSAGGTYIANTYGETACNDGEAWSAFFQVIPRAPRAGFVYLTLTETAGVLSAVSGPFFATALPADSGTVCHVPVAQSDGLGGLRQLHSGLLFWDTPSTTWLKLRDVFGTRLTGNAAGTFLFTSSPNAMIAGGVSSSSMPQLFRYDAADFPAVNGRTTKMRIKGEAHCNEVAPTGNFSFGLYEVTRPGSSAGGSNNIVFNLGSAVTGSTTGTINAPAARSSNAIIGSDFDVSNLTDGHYYALCVITTATIATSATVFLRAELHMRNY